MNTETILKQTTSFRDDLLKDLTDTEFAMYYLEAALADYKEDSNTGSLWVALRDVVEAQAAVSELSKRTGLDAETLLDALSTEDAPRLDILSTILNALECQLPAQHKADLSPEDVPTNKPLRPPIGVRNRFQRAQRAAYRFSDSKDQFTVTPFIRQQH